MKEIERVGLLKMDFLGLSTLTLIEDALAEIEAHDGRDGSISTTSGWTTRRPTSCSARA